MGWPPNGDKKPPAGRRRSTRSARTTGCRVRRCKRGDTAWADAPRAGDRFDL